MKLFFYKENISKDCNEHGFFKNCDATWFLENSFSIININLSVKYVFKKMQFWVLGNF